MIRFGVLTVSDRCARGQATDESGPSVRDAVTALLDATCIETAILPDEHDQIARWLAARCDADASPDLLLTTGGTGLAPRDVTPEATTSIIERPHPGLTELMRLRCLEHTPLAYLSRAVAGARRRTLIINLPGSPRGAVQGIQAIADVLEHALATLRADDVDRFHARLRDEP